MNRRELSKALLDVRADTITPGQWQTRIAGLLDRVELPELLARIDFDRLIQGFEYPDLGVSTRPVKFPQLDGLPESLAFYDAPGPEGRLDVLVIADRV